MSETDTVKNEALERIQATLAMPGSSHSMLLTTFRRNGEGVSTPVGMIASERKLYFVTPANSGKVKRLNRNTNVTLALSTFQGKALSPAVDGVARRLAGAEAQRARKLLRTGVLSWFWYLVFRIRYPGDKSALYEITL